jgi:hypothetical protein
MQNNLIGILYIATNEYCKFFDSFYESCQKYFLADCVKKYIVFTNDAQYFEKYENIIIINIDNLKWPDITLLRYEIILKNRNILSNFDYLIFCNANLLFKNIITKEELFQNKLLFAVKHPGYYNKSSIILPFYKNKYSTAYINKKYRKIYVAGGFNGGYKDEYIKLCEEIKDNINIDLSKNIIAKWHDESHFNRYVNMNINKFNILNKEYCWPEEINTDCDVKVIVRNKEKYISLLHKGLKYIILYKIKKIIKIIFKIMEI